MTNFKRFYVLRIAISKTYRAKIFFFFLVIWWWWWIVFAKCFTDGIREALFPVKIIVKDSNHRAGFWICAQNLSSGLIGWCCTVVLTDRLFTLFLSHGYVIHKKWGFSYLSHLSKNPNLSWLLIMKFLATSTNHVEVVGYLFYNVYLIHGLTYFQLRYIWSST